MLQPASKVKPRMAALQSVLFGSVKLDIGGRLLLVGKDLRADFEPCVGLATFRIFVREPRPELCFSAGISLEGELILPRTTCTGSCHHPIRINCGLVDQNHKIVWMSAVDLASGGSKLVSICGARCDGDAADVRCGHEHCHRPEPYVPRCGTERQRA